MNKDIPHLNQTCPASGTDYFRYTYAERGENLHGGSEAHCPVCKTPVTLKKAPGKPRVPRRARIIPVHEPTGYRWRRGVDQEWIYQAFHDELSGWGRQKAPEEALADVKYVLGYLNGPESKDGV